jgi:hypothetical protein
MVNGEEGEFVRYYPEKVNRPHGAALTGKTPDQNHMANWIECVRSPKTPNAPVESATGRRSRAHGQPRVPPQPARYAGNGKVLHPGILTFSPAACTVLVRGCIIRKETVKEDTGGRTKHRTA